jgi:hypothetical protein
MSVFRVQPLFLVARLRAQWGWAPGWLFHPITRIALGLVGVQILAVIALLVQVPDVAAVSLLLFLVPVVHIIVSLSNGLWAGRWARQPFARMFPPVSTATKKLFTQQVLYPAQMALIASATISTLFLVLYSFFHTSTTSLVLFTNFFFIAGTTVTLIFALRRISRFGIRNEVRSNTSSHGFLKLLLSQILSPLPLWMTVASIGLGMKHHIVALDAHIVTLVILTITAVAAALSRTPNEQDIGSLLTARTSSITHKSVDRWDAPTVAWATLRRSTKAHRDFWLRTVGLVVPVAAGTVFAAIYINHTTVSFAFLLYGIAGSLYFLTDLPDALFDEEDLSSVARRWLSAGKHRIFLRQRRLFHLKLLLLGILPIILFLGISSGLEPIGIILLFLYALVTVLTTVFCTSLRQILRYERVGGSGPAKIVQHLPLVISLMVTSTTTSLHAFLIGASP